MPVRATVTTISTLIVDDEQLASDELAYLLKDFPDVEITATGSNGLEALKLIESLEPDLVFLDVQMPGLDGMGVLHKLKERGITVPYVVLATAFDQYAIEAFKEAATDYLLKPVEKERLAFTIERVRTSMEERAKAPDPAEASARSPHRNKILVRRDSRNFIVDVQDVIYATIDEKTITVAATHFEGESTYKTIDELQASLDPEIFWRVHRAWLVNINRIKEVIPWFNSSFQIRMDDKRQTEVPVSRVQTKRLRSLFRL
jgi:two-component system response regulator LytT